MISVNWLDEITKVLMECSAQIENDMQRIVFDVVREAAKANVRHDNHSAISLNTSAEELVTFSDDARAFIRGIAEKIAAKIAEEQPNQHAKTDEDVREHVWSLTDGRCAYCGVELVRNQARNDERHAWFVVEHVVPVSAGGPDHIKNYVPSCWSCNTSKKDKHVLSFIKANVGGNVTPLSKRMMGDRS